jgi:hypothetical protein
MRKLEVKEDNWGIGRGYGQISEKKDDGTEIEGIVLTQKGIVKVYSVKYSKIKQQWTFVEIIKNGRLYVRTFNRFYSSRFLVTLAK